MVTKKDNSTNVISIKKGALNSIKLLIKRTTHSDHKPRKKDLYLRDERLIGYYIRIRPNGRKTYNCEAKLNGIGKKVSITIGDCDLFTEVTFNSGNHGSGSALISLAASAPVLAGH